jgi:hypothetical protein
MNSKYVTKTQPGFFYILIRYVCFIELCSKNVEVNNLEVTEQDSLHLSDLLFLSPSYNNNSIYVFLWFRLLLL